MNIWRFLYYTNKPSLVQIKTFQMRSFSHFQPILQLDLKWPLTLVHDLWLHDHMMVQILYKYYINKPSLVQIGLQLFKWGHFHIFNLSYNLTANDLWPWYMTFDLINKWGFPCCIYDPTLAEIHQSMWKIMPNVSPFCNRQQHQTTTGDKVIPMGKSMVSNVTFLAT